MKLVDVKLSTYIDYSKENNEKYTKFELADHVRISYKKYFAKCCIPNWPEDVFVIIKVQNIVPCLYVISDLIDK